MNRYLGGAIRLVFGCLKTTMANLRGGVRIGYFNTLDPSVEITIEKGTSCTIGKGWNARSGSILRVRKGAQVSIGRNFNLSTRSIITVRDSLTIGNNVTFGPGVMLYDHDHDYKAPGGVKSGKYKASPIKIGNNVWIGAGSIILRGAEIADNSIVAAGTVVRGKFGPNSLIYQQRETVVKSIEVGKMLS